MISLRDICALAAIGLFLYFFSHLAAGAIIALHPGWG